MYLEQEADTNDMLEENALEPIGVSIAAEHENAVTFAYTDDSMTATAVFGTNDEIPAGAELVVTPIDPESVEYTSLSSRAAELLDKEFIYDVTTCSFYDFALVSNNVDVTPKTGLVDIQIIFHDNTVEHLDDTFFAGRFARSADDSSDVKDELVSVNPDESSVIELADGIITVLSLKGNDLSETDSLVGILAGNVDEEIKAAAAETDAEIPEYDEEIEDVMPVKSLKASGNDYTVILTYDATSRIPDGAFLDVSEIAQDSEEYHTYLMEAKKAMGLTEEETLPGFAARFFDIKIIADDQEITPETGVSVEITYNEPLAEKAETEVNAVHFADEASEAEVIEASATEVQNDGTTTVEFTAESFSVYGVIYTVDFHWEVNGKKYDFSFPGGGFVSLTDLVEVLGIIDGIKVEEAFEGELTSERFAADVENIEFSDSELLSVIKIDEDTTVGKVKDCHGIVCKYSNELTQDQIDDINAQPLNAGDWVLISRAPFSSEETLTITMITGDVFTVQVTDAVQKTEETDPSIGYVLFYQDGSTYYVLKPDGTTETVSSTAEMDALSSEYQWTLTYVYVEDGIKRYNIRPYTDRTISLSLNHPGQPLIGAGPNNITVVPTAEGASTYIFGGYNNTKLKLQGDAFAGVDDGTSTPIQIYGLEPLHKFTFTVQTNNSSMGKVSGTDSSNTPQTKVERFTAESNTVQNPLNPKTNEHDITAVPDNTITGTDGKSKYILDHWEFNGKILYQGPGNSIITEYSGSEPAKYTNTKIAEGQLTIPENAGILTAVFKEDPNYKAKPEDKQGTGFNDMASWLSQLQNRNIPLNPSGTKKTAEVYDYENRIYRVDLTTQSNLRTFDGTIDLGFVLDVSGSMKFPSKLNEDTTIGVKNIWEINEASPYNNGYYNANVYVYSQNSYGQNTSGWENWSLPNRCKWQDWGLDTSKTYYVIAEEDTRATVFRIYYHSHVWRRVDASYVSTDSTYYKNEEIISSDTKFGVDTKSNHSQGYQIYVDGDSPNQRRNYEQAIITGRLHLQSARRMGPVFVQYAVKQKRFRQQVMHGVNGRL